MYSQSGTLNPLERFDVSKLWSEDDEGGGALADLISTVEEELEVMARADRGEDDREERELSTARLRERELERWLQQHTFSHSEVNEAVGRLQTLARVLDDKREGSEPGSPEHPTGQPPAWAG